MAPVGPCLDTVDRADDEQRQTREVDTVPQALGEPALAPRRDLHGNEQVGGHDPPRNCSGTPLGGERDQEIGWTKVHVVVGHESGDVDAREDEAQRTEIAMQ